MTLSCFTKLILVITLFSFKLYAGTSSPYFLLKNQIDQLELEKSQLIRESEALGREANGFFGSKKAKQKQLEIDTLIRETYDSKLIRLKDELEKTSFKEQIHIWNETLQKFTKDKRTLNRAFSERLGYVNLDCNPMFFKDEYAFNHWLLTKKNNVELDNRITFFSQKSDTIKACIDGIIDKRKIVKVDHRFSDCDGNYANPVKYEISLKNNFINIDLRFKLAYKGKAENMTEVKNKIDTTIPCVKKILANQGINLNFHYFFNDEIELKNPHATIYVYDSAENSNSNSWGILSNQGTRNSDEYLCVLLTHEIMHRLGLGDTYADARCPKRVIGKINEIMRTTSVSSAFAKLSDQEVKTIIAPLCASKRN